ncbi:MAG TPA: zinc-binding alcohol dehydrogenase [Vicinamibacterales bacterium]
MTRARAFWIVAVGRGEIRDEPCTAAADEVVIRAEYSGVSRGTESLVFNGRVPASEHQRMRAPFQAGDFPFPVKYGYASVGVVDSGPRELVGRRVFVLHPHQTRYGVPADAVHPVPDNVPPGRAVLAANLETAINGVWDGHPHVGDRITVIGAGTIGCLVAWIAHRIIGCDVELSDINPHRRAVADRLGVRFQEPAALNGDADLVFHASGSPGGLVTAMSVAGNETTIVDLSWYGAQVVPLALGEAFHSRRLTIRSSQVGRIAPGQRPRWDHRRRMALALSLLEDASLDALITGESTFDQLPGVLARLAASPGDELCHRIRYE